jgi:hypothetical protein
MNLIVAHSYSKLDLPKAARSLKESGFRETFAHLSATFRSTFVTRPQVCGYCAELIEENAATEKRPDDWRL